MFSTNTFIYCERNIIIAIITSRGSELSCYFIAQININDRDEYQKYLDGFDDIFSKYKGIVAAVDEDPVILEGTWPFTRTVLIRFPNKDEARYWYASPEYQELKKHRQRAADSNIILIERQK
jgi:uncharacterized protein (DUF1330 family)